MGLISKEAALAAIDHEREMLIEQRLLGAEHVVVHHARRLIEDMQTVPAVPLGPLCEFLAGNAWISCNTCNAVFGGCDENLRCGEDPKKWERILAKWMEEQDATD